MRIVEGSSGRIIVARLEPGDDILDGLDRVVRKREIKNAAIVNGVGSVSRYHIHVVETPNLPPGNLYATADGAFDVLSLTGLIMDGRIHAHITVADAKAAVGGHLEDGCEVLTFCLIMIVETPDMDLTDLDALQIPGV